MSAPDGESPAYFFYASRSEITPETQFARFGQILPYVPRRYFKPTAGHRFNYRIELSSEQLIEAEALFRHPDATLRGFYPDVVGRSGILDRFGRKTLSELQQVVR